MCWYADFDDRRVRVEERHLPLPRNNYLFSMYISCSCLESIIVVGGYRTVRACWCIDGQMHVELLYESGVYRRYAITDYEWALFEGKYRVKGRVDWAGEGF